MKRNDYFPHPVLRCNIDDVIPQLEINSKLADFSKDKNKFYIRLDLPLNNEEIIELIEKGKAEYVCEVSCPGTLLCHSVVSDTPHFEIAINRKSVSGRVDFNCYVAVKEQIKNYRLSGFNSDYDDAAPFNLDEGDVIVIYPTIPFNAACKFDKATSSYLKVQQGTTEDTEIRYKLTDKYIYVVMPIEMFNIYRANINRTPSVYHASFVLGALTYAIHRINEDEFVNSIWADAIKFRISTEQKFKDFCSFDEDGLLVLQPEEVPNLALKLLDDPIKELFNYIKEDN